MKKIISAALAFLVFSSSVFAGDTVNPHTGDLQLCPNVSEQDGSPYVQCPDIKVSNGTLTDNGDGTVSIQTGSGGGGDVSSNTATSVDGEAALFSGTGGKTIKRATGTGVAKLASGVLSAVSKLSASDINWTSLNADIQKSGINWSSVDGAVIQRAGINWNNFHLDAATGLNWSSFPGSATGAILQKTASGVNWSTAPPSGSGIISSVAYWTTATALAALQFFYLDSTNYILTIVSGLGSEKVTNGNFSSGSGWTAPTGWSISGGVANHNSNGTGALSQNIGSVNREHYRITFDAGGFSAGSFTVALAGVTIATVSANGSYSYDLITQSTANLTFTPTNTARFTLDNVSVKKFSGGQIRSGNAFLNGQLTVSAAASNFSPGTTQHIYLENTTGSYTWIVNYFGSVLRSAWGGDSSGNVYTYLTSGAAQYWYTISGSYMAYMTGSTFSHVGVGLFGSYLGASGGVNAGGTASPLSMLISQGSVGFKTCYVSSNTTLDYYCNEVYANCDNASACTGTPTYGCNHWTNSTDCALRSSHGGCSWFSGNDCGNFNYESGMSTCSSYSGSGCTVQTASCAGPTDQYSCEAQDDSYGGSCSFVNCGSYGNSTDCTNAGCSPNTADCSGFDESTCNSYAPDCTANTSSCSAYQNNGDGCNGMQPGSCSSTSNGCSTWNGDESGCNSNGCYWDGMGNCYEACIGSYFTSCSGSYFTSCSGDYCTGTYNTGICSGTYGAECQGSPSCSGISGGSTPCNAEAGCSYSSGCSITMPADSGTSWYRFYTIFNAGSTASITVLPNTGQTINGTTSATVPSGKKARRFTFFYFQYACSTWSGTNSTTCTTGHSGCSWTACSTYNGDESGCNSAGGDCSYDSGMSVCNGNGVCNGTWTVTRDWSITAGVF